MAGGSICSLVITTSSSHLEASRAVSAGPSLPSVYRTDISHMLCEGFDDGVVRVDAGRYGTGGEVPWIGLNRPILANATRVACGSPKAYELCIDRIIV